ncbi:amidohydrolase [Clostridium acetobutylicum]|uniref:Metal-dependent amidohydrolase n=1 Tax=Clostridium acetobutylicum (strain ATCC 824 / DSM 792 / JCM 1419 / IAM 19013 / LMG 5710 / NBRC 13948 / NRRL B-527 / VKM B-1787 / 2291 / W) TaxID=272562 RepID=Q97KJ8_CLOAB|nr:MULTISPECIES: M20 peptidase aminoacylase family protein [Clostridium]AAK78897.1 Metal-dependent amidohydrolase [Clostridium acetobutylicum ATCC 824]ADZ19972.1 Metal-dependent amidohydrolase [Clostridium acetobutylicum EA 2018]AEI34131.1 metal-dependent amidohydrolase [Clostridium acetobutylicum DSM 1731]AWV80616.1 amidohydrolase [Clostridium acetobutylicum]MBC2392806.1 amidohydrolase [Clostridium acetobutylicum]
MITIEKQEEFLKKLIGYRRELHKHPELSMKEYETTKRIKRWLYENDIKVLDFPIEVGVVAEIEGEHEGKTVAIRADIDALPIEEKTELPFSSVNKGIMHACGHDFHTAAILGTAIILSKRKAEIYGRVRIIFQPGEETGKGSQYIIEEGVLRDVDCIFGMHNKPDLPVGTIGIRSGELMASVDRFEIKVIGSGGHAGIPNKCIDPIVVASQIVASMQTVVSRSISPIESVVISITRFNSGTTWNVISDSAEMEGTVRTFNNNIREEIRNLMERTAKGIARALGGKIEFKWFSYSPVLENDVRFKDLCIEAAEDNGYKYVEAKRNLGGEDFSFYQTVVPSFFVWMGVDGTEEWHKANYNLKEDALMVAANYFSDLALKVLSKK